MSQPVLSGERLQVQVADGVLRITNDPGFSSDNGDGCPYRAVWIPGQYGRELGKTTRPDDRWQGFFATRSELAAWRSPRLPAGTWRVRVYGGTFFKGWGDVPQDCIEWGSDDQGKNPSGVPRVNEVTFTVGKTPKPEPPRPELTARLQTLVDNIRIEQRDAKASFEKWRAAQPDEWRSIEDYLRQLSEGSLDRPGPNLKTHRGRAVSGLLQISALVMRELK